MNASRVVGDVRTPDTGTRCAATVEGREPCRYVPRREGYCSRHFLDPRYPRAVDRARWCSYRLPRLGALCQNFVMPGSSYCSAHDPRRRPGLPRPELNARAVVLNAVGGNAGALTMLLGVLAAEGATSWAAVLRIARREGLAQ